MKKVLFLALICSVSVAVAQNISYHESEVFTSAPSKVEPQSNEDILSVKDKKAKSHHGEMLDMIKAPLDKARKRQFKKGSGTQFKTVAAVNPSVGNGFTTHFQQGIPNDNNVAISDSGLLVSVSNSSISVFNQQGALQSAKSLKFFASGGVNVNFPFDPHVLYDPEEDRFVVTFLDGSNSSYTKLIVAFSQTNDPSGTWNFYALPGNVHGDNTWSDYPFPALSKNDVFISVLLWKNGESGWDSEATNELIWQIDKQKGYTGDSLQYKYYDSIVINGRQVWNTRPIKGGSGLYGPNMFLLANRAIDLANDSIFLFEITNSLSSGLAQLNINVLTAPLEYGIPPSAFQPDSNNVLRTNYADIHDGFYENNIIHFVGNSIDTGYMAPGIYYGQINDPGGQASVTTSIFSTDTLDLNYPSIAYAGNSQWDHSALIHCLHSSPTTYPGTSVFYTDGEGDFSDLVRVKSGVGIINSLGGAIERWGDYTGIQRKYNAPGTCWLMGSWGQGSGINPDNWVAEISSTNSTIGIPTPEVIQGFRLYPNPSSNVLRLDFEAQEPKQLKFAIFNLSGVLIWKGEERVGEGVYKIQIDLNRFDSGYYILEIKDAEGSFLRAEKFIISHK